MSRREKLLIFMPVANGICNYPNFFGKCSLLSSFKKKNHEEPNSYSVPVFVSVYKYHKYYINSINTTIL